MQRSEALLSLSIRQSLDFAVIMLDLDDFKKYNDAFGHQKGDDVIVMQADLMREIFKRQTDVLGRYGGEEFAMLLPTTPLHHAEVLLDRVRENILGLGIAHPKSEAGLLTVSIGISCADSKAALMEHDLHAFMDRADQALYEAKSRGRNRIAMYHPDQGILDTLQAV